MGKQILIGITGRMGHGKDTAAQALDDFENVKMAGALKAMVRAFLAYVGHDEAFVERCIEGDMKETPLGCFGMKSTRYVLQTLGTEWGRNLIWENLWVNAFGLRAAQFDKVVCTDVRHPNEVNEIKNSGGTMVRVVNPRIPAPVNDHASEAFIDTLPVDWVIFNDHGIEDLHLAMRTVSQASGAFRDPLDTFLEPSPDMAKVIAEHDAIVDETGKSPEDLFLQLTPDDVAAMAAEKDRLIEAAWVAKRDQFVDYITE
jgi:hypothetical protein